MLRTLSGSSGSKYRRVDASKSVDTVSGFEFTITALQPSRRNAGRLDRAVVELDPLPDPDRAAADHEGGGAGDRGRLGGDPADAVAAAAGSTAGAFTSQTITV